MTVAMGAAVFVLISLSCLEQRDFSRRGLRAGRWIVREGFQILPAQHPAHPALDLRDIAVDRGQVLNERVLELQVRQRLVRKLDDGVEPAVHRLVGGALRLQRRRLDLRRDLVDEAARALLHRGRARAHRRQALAHGADRGADLVGGLADGDAELTHVLRDHREAPALLADPRRLDPGVDREQVRILGKAVDGADRLLDAVGEAQHFRHRRGLAARVLLHALDEARGRGVGAGLRLRHRPLGLADQAADVVHDAGEHVAAGEGLALRERFQLIDALGHALAPLGDLAHHARVVDAGRRRRRRRRLPHIPRRLQDAPPRGKIPDHDLVRCFAVWTSWLASKGFTIQPTAPASFARRIIEGWPSVVSIRIGSALCSGLLFTFSTISSPFRFGMLTSQTTMSMARLDSIAASASWPSAAATIANPARFRAIATSWPTPPESSTTRIVFAM